LTFKDVATILNERCVLCHQGDAEIGQVEAWLAAGAQDAAGVVVFRP